VRISKPAEAADQPRLRNTANSASLISAIMHHYVLTIVRARRVLLYRDLLAG